MIKGVNKTIIEVSRPDSIYFEKAVFYLRPNVRELPTEVSREEIARCISRLGLKYRRERRSAVIGRVLIITLMLAAVGAMLYVLLR